MDRSDAARERLIEELDSMDWQVDDEETLDALAERMKQYFASLDEAREFVDINVSALFKEIEEE